MAMRLHLLCVASTASVRAVAFPADEPVDRRGLEGLRRLKGKLPCCDVVLRSPSLSAAQTVDGLGLSASVAQVLRDCDVGSWSGRALAEVQAETPQAVTDWLRGVRGAPHGGESFAAVMTRVGGWMDGLLTGRGAVLAITHAPVIRAAIAHALGAGPASFLHIDVAPLTRARLSCGGGRWTLNALLPVKETQ